MSPRRNRRNDDAKSLDESVARRGVEYVRDGPDGAWTVRHLTGDTSGKTYRCPGCDQEIKPGVPHVVAWPTDGWGDETDRRHWHTPCWRARHNRHPPPTRKRPL